MRTRLAAFALIVAAALSGTLLSDQERRSVQVRFPTGSPDRDVPGPTAVEEAGLPPVSVPLIPSPEVSRTRGAHTPHNQNNLTRPSREATRGSPRSPESAGAPIPIRPPVPISAPAKPARHSGLPGQSAPQDSRRAGRMPGNAASAPAISDPAQAGADSTAGQPISGLQSPDGQAGQQQAASPAEGASRPTDQRHTPVLTPPVLLTASEAASSQSAQVTLDRTMLTPQLRITALEGRVVLAVLVRVDGSVGWVRIESSSGIDPLDTAAVKAAEIWRFRPATRDGVSTESWAIIAVRFVLP